MEKNSFKNLLLSDTTAKFALKALMLLDFEADKALKRTTMNPTEVMQDDNNTMYYYLILNFHSIFKMANQINS
jgi:hypothetical protein